jgi:hypothetical protein
MAAGQRGGLLNQAIWANGRPFGQHIHAERHSRSGRTIAAAASARLFKRLLRAATNHGIETIEIVCLPENVRMQNLAKKFHTHFAFEVATGRLTARGRPLSLIREASGDALDLSRVVRRPLAGGAEARERRVTLYTARETGARHQLLSH